MSNQYTITAIDQAAAIVYATFDYNGHLLNHQQVVATPDDSTAITRVLDADYLAFTQQMDAIDAAPATPAAVVSLIDAPRPLTAVESAQGGA